MAWLITKDYLADEREPEGTPSNAVGITGPSHASDTVLDLLRKGAGEAFRLYDDDGVRYYSGRWLPSDDADAYEVPEMQPLFDFGAPNAGAADIRFYDRATKKWAPV